MDPCETLQRFHSFLFRHQFLVQVFFLFWPSWRLFTFAFLSLETKKQTSSLHLLPFPPDLFLFSLQLPGYLYPRAEAFTLHYFRQAVQFVLDAGCHRRGDQVLHILLYLCVIVEQHASLDPRWPPAPPPPSPTHTGHNSPSYYIRVHGAPDCQRAAAAEQSVS